MMGTIVASVVAVGAFAYSVGKDVGQTELTFRQDLAALDLPSITADSRAATSDLKTASAEFKELLVNNATYQEAMRTQREQLETIERLNKEVEALTEKTRQQMASIESLKSRLAVFENPDRVYELKKGQSQQVGGGQLIVGLQYYLSGFAELTINGSRHSGQAGDVIEVDGLKGGKCRVKVISVSLNDEATFSAECGK